MKRLTVEKPVNEMDMTELAHNCMFAKNRWAWYRDYEGEKDLMELIREMNVVIGGSELPENNTLLEEVLQDNLQYSLSDKDGLIAFIYQSLWTKANLRERLKEYEDTDLTPEQIREKDKRYAEQCRELAEYQKAEESGLLLRLLCKPRDTVYRIDIDPKVKPEITPYYIDHIIICDNGEVLIQYDPYDGVICSLDNLINNTPYLDYYMTYLTRDEAEEKLAEKQIEAYITKCGYTYTVQGLLPEYKKYTSGIYVSYTAEDCITNCKSAFERLAEMEGGHE